MIKCTQIHHRFPGGSAVKICLQCSKSRSLGSIPGLGRSSEEGNGNPLQYSCLGNSMDKAWQATIHGVTRVGHDWATKPPPPPQIHHLDSTIVYIFLHFKWYLCLRRLYTCIHGFRKGRGTRDQIANIRWIMEKAREFQKNIYFCFTDYAKAFACVDHKKLWKILKEMGIPDHLTCLLRNLYAGQEATVRTGHGGEGNGTPLQYSCLENPMDGGAW